jgi:hypothetical protein
LHATKQRLLHGVHVTISCDIRDNYTKGNLWYFIQLDYGFFKDGVSNLDY